MTRPKSVNTLKPKNTKYKVHPNLTPRGKDIMIRLRNKSLVTSGGDNYTLDDEIVRASRYNKKDLINKARENAEKIQGYEKELSKPKPKPEEPKTDQP